MTSVELRAQERQENNNEFIVNIDGIDMHVSHIIGVHQTGNRVSFTLELIGESGLVQECDTIEDASKFFDVCWSKVEKWHELQRQAH